MKRKREMSETGLPRLAAPSSHPVYTHFNAEIDPGSARGTSTRLLTRTAQKSSISAILKLPTHQIVFGVTVQC